MATARVLVTRWLSDDFPGFVEFVLTDTDGVEHTFQEKPPVLSTEELSRLDAFQRELWIDADVLSEQGGSTLVRLAHSVESLDGRTEFHVPMGSLRASGGLN